MASVEAARRDGTVVTLPGPPADSEAFRDAYGGDPLDDDTLAFVVDSVRCVPDTVHHYFQPVDWSRAAHVPVVYALSAWCGSIPVTPTGGHASGVVRRRAERVSPRR